jgi:hypothetical protein
MTEQILIASNSFDGLHVDPVAKLLDRQGYEVIRYEADKVSIGETALSIGIDTQNDTYIDYDGRPLRPQEVAAAWSRRPHNFGPFFDTEDRGTRISLDREYTASQQLLFDLVPKDCWLNAPEAMRQASHKLTQLVLARSIGFEIPTTTTTNQWEEVTSRLGEGEIVYKPFYGELYEGSEVKIVYSNVLQNDKSNPPVDGLPYPGIWQDYKQKAREWRITVFGDDSFDATVDTDAEAKDVWRRHQASSRVTFSKDTFPEREKEKCHELLDQSGLRFGVFDFIEQPDGRIVFLEMNPNGQYIWLEDMLGLPISQAVASELGRLAAASM